MKVGDYVRINDGIIGKAIIVSEYCVNIEDKFIRDINDVIKSSPNIIDLIEVGDYVNGYKILDIEKSNIVDKDGNFIKEKIKLIIGRDMYGFPEYIEEKDIKSILTKEMFGSMEYKVGD